MMNKIILIYYECCKKKSIYNGYDEDLLQLCLTVCFMSLNMDFISKNRGGETIKITMNKINIVVVSMIFLFIAKLT